MSGTDELTAFLGARYDEAEAIALKAIEETRHCDECGKPASGHWVRHPTHPPLLQDEASESAIVYDEQPRDGMLGHIALHDPAAVLADIAAKRKRIATYIAACSAVDRYDDQYMAGVASGLGDVLKDDAEIYSSHPDYRQTWKP